VSRVVYLVGITRFGVVEELRKGLKGIDELKKGERIVKWKEGIMGCNLIITDVGYV